MNERSSGLAKKVSSLKPLQIKINLNYTQILGLQHAINTLLPPV
jgi:hypothetical protein